MAEDEPHITDPAFREGRKIVEPSLAEVHSSLHIGDRCYVGRVVMPTLNVISRGQRVPDPAVDVAAMHRTGS